jgi:hypothetical protein
MSYLSNISYYKIIEKALLLEKERIPFYFINQHNLFIKTNLDFKESLSLYIGNIEKQLNKFLKNVQIEKKIGLKEADKGGNFIYYLDGILTTVEVVEKKIEPIESNEYDIFTIEPPFNPGLKINTNKIYELREGFNIFNNHILNKQDEITTQNLAKTKLKWKGSPAQFGFLIQELIGKGWISKPTGSFLKDAKFLMELFDINTTPGNLENEINPNRNSLTKNNSILFKIPSIESLSQRESNARVSERKEN